MELTWGNGVCTHSLYPRPLWLGFVTFTHNPLEWSNQLCISGAQLSTASGLSLVVEPIDLILLCANDRVALPAGQPVFVLI